MAERRVGSPKKKAAKGARARRPGELRVAAGEGGETLDVIVRAAKGRRPRCRALDGSPLLVQTSPRWAIPGVVLAVQVVSRASAASGELVVDGEVVSSRVDVPALRLAPIPMRSFGPIDPEEEIGDLEGEPLPDWAGPIVARGPRVAWEMDDLVPLPEPGDDDAVYAAMEIAASGDVARARAMLFAVLDGDLRALAAHSALGDLAFARDPARAFLHYMVGAAIGDAALGAAFDGMLPWGLVDNRPFLRCLHGLGNTLWRRGLVAEATSTYERMLWLNPRDNQGVRTNLALLARGVSWAEASAHEPTGWAE